MFNIDKFNLILIFNKGLNRDLNQMTHTNVTVTTIISSTNFNAQFNIGSLT